MRVPFFTAIIYLAGWSLSAAIPAAAEPIGMAESVVNHVTGTTAAAEMPMHKGDPLSAGTMVTTRSASATILRLKDNTEITIGAGARVMIEKFELNPDHTAKVAVIRVASGMMRFVTGRSSPENFTILTSSSTIAIRGTDVTIEVDSKGDSNVAVTSGRVLVAPGAPPGVTGKNIETKVQNLVSLDKTINFATVTVDGKSGGGKSIPPANIAKLNKAAAKGETSSSASAAAADGGGSGGGAGGAGGAGASGGDDAGAPSGGASGGGQSSANSFAVTPVFSGGPGGGAVSP